MKTKVYVCRVYEQDVVTGEKQIIWLAIHKPNPRGYDSEAIMGIDPRATYVGGPSGIHTIDKSPNQEIVDLLLFNHDYEVMTDAQVRNRYR